MDDPYDWETAPGALPVGSITQLSEYGRVRKVKPKQPLGFPIPQARAKRRTTKTKPTKGT